MELTQAQWELVEPVLLSSVPKKKVSGRPRRDDRDILNGILWVCRTGAPWQDMPDRYPPYQTCHRRFQEWVEMETWEKILVTLAVDLKRRGKIDLSEAFIDGSFAAAKKGALALGKPSVARAARSWQSQTVMVFLSPYAHMKPEPMRLNLLKQLYQQVLSGKNRKD